MQKELTGWSGLVFEVLKEYTGCILSRETIEALLRTDSCQEDCEVFQPCNTPTGYGRYPQCPLYIKLSEMLAQWARHEKSVVTAGKAINFELLKDDPNTDGKEEASNLVDFKLKIILESWDNILISEKKELILNILELLQLRGILDLIGMRQTVGSVDLFPPPLSVLWKSFKEKHKSNSNLSCGARALSKHSHRDSTSQWWGTSTGSEHDKNEHANTVLGKILGDAAWINIHLLPHDVEILEVRNSLGYGARWLCDGTVFRGFLEPQMHDGHTAGWKH